MQQQQASETDLTHKVSRCTYIVEQIIRKIKHLGRILRQDELRKLFESQILESEYRQIGKHRVEQHVVTRDGGSLVSVEISNECVDTAALAVPAIHGLLYELLGLVVRLVGVAFMLERKEKQY